MISTYNLAMPAFRTAAAHALMAVNKALRRIVNSPLAPGNFFFCSRTKLVTVTQSVSIRRKSKKKAISKFPAKRHSSVIESNGVGANDEVIKPKSLVPRTWRVVEKIEHESNQSNGYSVDGVISIKELHMVSIDLFVRIEMKFSFSITSVQNVLFIKIS